MSAYFDRFQGLAWPFLSMAGPALALLVALAGATALRRRAGGLPVVAAVAVLAGWAVVAGAGWRTVLWPRGVAEHLVLPALVVAAVGMLARYAGGRWAAGRWAGFWTTAFAAWWLAGAGTVRPEMRLEFFRMLFGGLFAAWLLRRFGADQPPRAVAAGLALAGGAFAAGVPGMAGPGLVVAAAACGVSLMARTAAVPVGLSMAAGLVTLMGAGRMWRGGVGIADLACLGALAAPAAVPWVQQRMGRLGRRAAALLAPLVTAGGIVGLAWVGERLWRGH